MRQRFGLAVLAVSLACASAPALAYTTLFAFGDSLSDAGNDYIFDGKTDPVPPYYKGHFSNGPTWAEDLYQRLGLGTPLTPLAPSLAGGHDYAFGGAQTGPTNVEKFPNPGDLLGQVQQYGLKYPHYQGALYAFDIGGNDIMNALGAYAPGGVMTPSGFSAVTTVVNQAASNTALAVKELWAFGARNLLFYEVPDLGLTPKYRGTALQSWASYFALSFDQTVLNDIHFLKSYPYNLKEYAVDTYHLLDDVVSDPDYFYSSYGIKFTDVTDPCWTGNFTSSTSGAVCPNPTSICCGTTCIRPRRRIF
jgi:phospholipase/lecithinase/hemolysin